MEYSDYVHLVRTHEQASQDQPEAYRRRVLCFAVLGYAAVFVLALLALAGLAWLGGLLLQGRVRGWMVWPGLACLGLLWATLTGMRVPFSEPEGERLQPEDAPELFAGLDRIRDKVKGPALHAVIINGDFNAAIVQQPLWLGLAHRNYLILGWPMMAALEPRRLYAVIAHEYGHLRGEHGKLSAWIYRSRRAWAGLSERYSEQDSIISLALAGFVRWYFPRFNALSFALARQDEYEADRVSARLFGAELAGQTLQEVAAKGQIYAEDFWRNWWRLARERGDDRPAPHAQMSSMLQHVAQPDRAQRALRQALRRVADPDDTHPVLKDRLAALGQGVGLGALSPRSALRLLGPAREHIGAALDAQWWQGARQDWARHGERLRALHADVRAFQARNIVGDALSVEELLHWAQALEALSERDPSPLLERALQLAPQHEQVLLRLARHHAPLGSDDGRVGMWLDLLYQQHPAQAWRAATLARQWLDACAAEGRPQPAEQRQLWRERLARSEAQEQQSWEQFANTPCWERPLPVQLEETTLRELRGQLLRERDVRAAWLGSQDIPVHPARPHHTLWLQCRPGLGRSAATALAQQIYDAIDLPGRFRVVVIGVHVDKGRQEQASLLLTLVQRR
jgi:Peptidase family M48